ncbi:MAG: double-strand break repair protein AddB, partial [Hyphomicrobiales bacterium]
TRKDVGSLADGSIPSLALARAQLFSEVMRPSATTDLWHHRIEEIKKSAPDAVRDLHHVKAANRREEALAIAALMRKTLETPGRTAALITPDRTLGRQVCAELTRWSLAVDDSAGIPLARTEQGRLVHLMLDAVSGFNPPALVSLANHPMARFGGAPGAFARAVNKLQIAVLRGPVFARSLSDLADQLERRRADVEAKPHWFAHMRAWNDADWHEAHWALEKLIGLTAPFENMFEAGGHIRFDVIIKVVLEQLERLSADEAGDTRTLWQGEAGENLSAFFSSLLEASADAPLMGTQDIEPVIMDLMMMPVVRPRYGSHPRLQILGLLEARMISADVMILGGLNEDVWPRLPRSDPWLNRPMRGELGLQQPERRIGLAAHDFVQAVCGGAVWITTSERLEGAPAVPSRWMLRLQALLTACGVTDIAKDGRKLLATCAQLDDGGTLEPVSRPAPRPPVATRPRRLSITEVETWLRDPYSIFARHVLQLTALEPLNVAPGPRELGILFHGILEEFFLHHQANLPGDIAQKLNEIADAHFAQYSGWPEINAFWRPRFANVARAIAETEPGLRAASVNTYAESYGRAVIAAPAGDFELTGRADRIDILDDGSARIFDYKTGRIPSNNEVLSGLAPQLLLEAALLARSGFKDIAAAKQAALTYLHITGGDPAIEMRDIKPQKGQVLGDICEDVFANLVTRVTEFDDAQTPYPSRRIPRVIGQVFGYDHLARHREWANAETSGGDA